MDSQIPENINIKESLEVRVKMGEPTECVVCELIGFIDAYNSIEFTKHINLIVNRGYNNVILDCTELNYVASSGVGSFTSIIKTLKQRDGNLIFACLQKRVHDIFKILKMDKFFIIKNSVDEALNFIKT